MDEAVFIAQYTFLATPAVIEEESRILGKIARRLRCEYVIRFAVSYTHLTLPTTPYV